MDLLIKKLHLLIVFQIATANAKLIYFPYLQSYVRIPRNLESVNNAPNSLGISGTVPFSENAAVSEEQYKQFSLFSKEVPQYRSNNKLQNQLEAFLVPSNNLLQYRTSNDRESQPQQLGGVVDEQLHSSADTIKPNENEQVLDNIIKDRVLTLQTFQGDFNKLLDDMAEAALSFISKNSYFGGITRRSLLDPSNMDNIKVIHTDIIKVGADFYQIFGNFFDDLDAILHYIADRRNFNLKDIFSNGVSTMLRIFTV